MKDFSVYCMSCLIDHVQGDSHVAAMRAVERKYGTSGPVAICPLDAPPEAHRAAAARSYYKYDEVPPELRG
ncbi:hypothetical protein [Burkholderia multivorans]|uniref:hypothetical protein n=1 Tax=Burkholderia multivorans TaxID=87883 RepID=UPI00057FE1A5|nr:hypothetical protein [Burkholderia multivorans]KHS09443.1 hypothetical protein BMD20_29710 [Burkholderia multivorans]KHS10360.1 hypothetical protein BMD22_28115 [Burkholderia multivorans]MDR9229995.1 hypothetical protein [Burkholderia multivorans]HDR9474357.1 hypothetical protein [Burkholderia multivorans]HDR9480199.1 hypothetical protein [Burkholderia multivorans]